ncbi:hypothetical protein KAH27_09675 [bacterium]|nr:hypothetical protein [bacterium]
MKNLFIITLASLFITNLVYCETENNTEIIEKADEYILNNPSDSRCLEPISQYGIMKMRGKTIADYKLKNEANKEKLEKAKKEVVYWVKKIMKSEFIPANLETKLVELDDFPPRHIQKSNVIRRTNSIDFIIAKYNIDNHVVTIKDKKNYIDIGIYKSEENKINNVTNYIIDQLEYFFNFTTNDTQKYTIFFDEQANGIFRGRLIDKVKRPFFDGDTFLYDWKLCPGFLISKNYINYSFSKGENKIVDVSRIKRAVDTLPNPQRF